ncbi:ABC transporter substrate-binding protein [Pseudoalteromonas sp. XMcav2-N-2]|uniref:ABC transporter substrate-binding protein n=1 Tax=unclassified Pseudoalteromonas TaxID=194690 RepID=UPI002096ED50|nr:ABC transporter substrate-binding protein [Pseudoalteromonas sp. XMcav2-N]
MKFVQCIFWGFLLLSSHLSFAKADFSVLLVNPSISGEPFWQKVESIAQAASKQLNVKLDVIYGDGSRYIQLAELQKYLEYRATPDFVVLMLYPGNAEQHLDLLEKYGIQYLTLEQTINGPEQTEIGKPGQRYKNWLGEIYFDNFRAGAELAKALTESLREKDSRVKPKAIAINGHYGSESDARNQGAQSYFGSEGVALQQSIYASWSKTQAMEKTQRLLKRYPETNIIWSASDLMAMGALSAVKQQSNDKNRFVAIGGFDWLNDTLGLIDKGEIQASVGGHFIMGGLAILSLYDRFHGHKYWHDHQSITYPLVVINRQNVHRYLWLADKSDWSGVDFSKFSLLKNKQQQYLVSPAFLARDTGSGMIAK